VLAALMIKSQQSPAEHEPEIARDALEPAVHELIAARDA
jgi:hypothetical protein